jgi:hypothetical protein
VAAGVPRKVQKKSNTSFSSAQYQFHCPLEISQREEKPRLVYCMAWHETAARKIGENDFLVARLPPNAGRKCKQGSEEKVRTVLLYVRVPTTHTMRLLVLGKQNSKLNGPDTRALLIEVPEDLSRPNRVYMGIRFRRRHKGLSALKQSFLVSSEPNTETLHSTGINIKSCDNLQHSPFVLALRKIWPTVLNWDG